MPELCAMRGQGAEIHETSDSAYNSVDNAFCAVDMAPCKQQKLGTISPVLASVSFLDAACGCGCAAAAGLVGVFRRTESLQCSLQNKQTHRSIFIHSCCSVALCACVCCMCMVPLYWQHTCSSVRMSTNGKKHECS